MQMIRSVVSGVPVCLVLAAMLLSSCESADEVVKVPMLTVEVVDSMRRDVPLSIEMVGTTLGAQDVPIRARVEGFLETMNFREGLFVEKGDLLYTIDAQPFQAKLVEAQSMLAGAQTALAKAEADLRRIRPLAEMNAVSEQDLDAAVAQDAAARAGVRAAEAQVSLAEIELSYTRISAPIDGLIGLTKARPGEFVGREPNPVVLNTLSDIDPIRVRFSISEREYLILARNYLEMGGSSDRTRDADKQAELELILADGTVHKHPGKASASSQAINPETGTYTVDATFPNPRGLLLPGQFARVKAPYRTLENVVVVPKKIAGRIARPLPGLRCNDRQHGRSAPGNTWTSHRRRCRHRNRSGRRRTGHCRGHPESPGWHDRQSTAGLEPGNSSAARNLRRPSFDHG